MNYAILGNDVQVFGEVLKVVLPAFRDVEYTFMAEDEFRALEPAAMTRVYWSEMLYRSHWAAAATLLRAQLWLQGAADAYEANNLLAFAACCRGLIEASADSHYSIRSVPETLARDHRMIADALAGVSRTMAVNPELEEQLIHFTHGRKVPKGSAAPASHRALHLQDYLADLNKIQPNVGVCYGVLCDFTHPGASSVLSFATAVTPDASRVRLLPTAEKNALPELKSAVASVGRDVLMLGLNSALVTLRVLNELPLTSLHVPQLQHVVLREIPVWRKAAAHLGCAA